MEGNDNYALLRKLSWSTLFISFGCCLMRHDYNIILGVALVIILNRFINDSPMFYLKVIIHLLIAFLSMDGLWALFVLPIWFGKGTLYWKGLLWIKIIGTVFAGAGMVIKGAMIAMVYKMYKKDYSSQMNYLKVFDYFVPQAMKN